MNTIAEIDLKQTISPDKLKNSSLKKPSKSQACACIDIIHERTPLRIAFKNILYADTFKNAVYVHTDMGVFKTYITFEKFRLSLCGDCRFINCYKGCVVNMDRARKITGEDFIMDNGERVQIRKRGCSAVKKTYLQYVLSKDVF